MFRLSRKNFNMLRRVISIYIVSNEGQRKLSAIITNYDVAFPHN